MLVYWISMRRGMAVHFYIYGDDFRGFAAKLSKEQAEQIVEIPGVILMFPNRKRTLHTTRSSDFMGLAMDETNIRGFSTQNQENMIIGFIDTGLEFLFKVEMLEAELRETVMIEAGLYCVVASHGSSAQKAGYFGHPLSVELLPTVPVFGNSVKKGFVIC